MDKVDFKKEFKHLYNSSAKEAVIVDVPEMNFLMIDGHGDPNTSIEYRQAIEALYSVSYTLKFSVKKAGVADYGVLPLEGLWWVDDMSKFSTDDKDAWKWTAMIMQPKFVTKQLFAEAIEAVKKKELPALTIMEFKPFVEGLSAQIMHIGPYAEEGPTIQRLHEFIKAQGHGLRGKHHEIYLSDPRRCAPEKIKTIIRQPMS